jgi:hypothetical protein
MSDFLRYDAVHPDAMVADSAGEWVPLAEVLRIINERDNAERLAAALASDIDDLSDGESINQEADLLMTLAFDLGRSFSRPWLDAVRKVARNWKEAPK